MKESLWKRDWFAGLIITLAFLTLNFTSNFIDGIESNAYDFGVRQSSRIPSDKIAIIAIDDQSIENIGRWPWSREIQAQMHTLLAEGGAKAIGQTVFFTEPQLDPGLKYIRELRQNFESNIQTIEDSETAEISKDEPTETSKDIPVDTNSTEVFTGNPALKEVADFLKKSPNIAAAYEAYVNYLKNAESELDTDSKLAASMEQAGNVTLSMVFALGAPLGRPDEDLPAYVTRQKLPKENITDNASVNPDGFYPYSTVAAIPPIAVVGEQASGIASLAIIQDSDGGVRKDPLIIDHFGDYYPSMALMLAAKSLNLSVNDIKVNMSQSVQLGRLTIKTDESSLMNTFFYNVGEFSDAFSIDSFYDVIQGKIPADKYKNKVVLIGATAYGVGTQFVTPVNPAMSPVETLAHTISSILNEDFFTQPEWSGYATTGVLFLVIFYLMLLLPRLGAAVGFTLTTIFFIALFMTHYILMTTQSLWVPLMTPTVLLVAGHLLMTTKRFLLTEKGKLKLDIESAESNRMLGLSLQGQGQLDMAFEKFRKLPVDKSVLELLYNLSLDYERKRQFNKAKSVYDFIADHDPKFRDIKTRANRAQAMEETVILGGGGSSPGGTLMLDGGGIEKPMLGRYEVERELGKGAMGAVYLGKDPKISRVVAIKTMALSQEFEDDELEDVKARFFREAETAGRLTHPAIVTIYDAGEEHDLAFIAMEFLKGSDLSKYVKKDNLMPVTKVLSIIKTAAEGLDYAHKNQVVHRDIKPANLMYDEESDVMKITDFGIARITDSSKTKTGMVLGTPSYMSPEQLAGKKVEGQSDLFSLGVMLFQMVTGQLPFTGDSMATLMFKIANEEHPSPESVNPNLPRCITVIINRALEKDVEKRYKTGAQIAGDITKCLKIIEAEGSA